MVGVTCLSHGTSPRAEDVLGFPACSRCHPSLSSEPKEHFICISYVECITFFILLDF